VGAFGDAASIAAEESSAEVWDVVGVKAETGEESEVVGLRRVVSLLPLVAAFAVAGVQLAAAASAQSAAPAALAVGVDAAVDVA
jgi:hypothetical protein